MQDLQDLIETFLGQAAELWHRAHLEKLSADEILPRGVEMAAIAKAGDKVANEWRRGLLSDPLAELVERNKRRNKAARELLATGRELATQLESAGQDSTPLLMFLHTLDAAGGPEAAAPLWAPLKVSLQRLVVREGLSQAETSTAPAANLGREWFNVASWPLYPFGDLPRLLPPKTPPFMYSQLRAGERYTPPAETTREGTPTPGGTVRLERAGVAVELYFPTDADRATLAAALPECDLDAPPWHAVQTRLVAAGLSADWERLTAPAAVAMLARTATPPAATATPPGTRESEGDGHRTPGGTAPAPGDATSAETIDAAGYVTNPKDPTAYLAAADVLGNHTPAAIAITPKQLRAILDKHAEIRRWRPRTNRLNIHLGDWTAYVKKEASKIGDDGLLADELEIEARKAEIRRRKTSGK